MTVSSLLVQRWFPAQEPLAKHKHKRQESCYSRNGKRRLNIYMATVLAVFAITIVLGYTNTNHIRVLTSHQEVKLDAIVTVAMCGFGANEMVKALRSKGEWKGPIYVITDDPSQEDANLCTPVNVRGNHPTFLTQEEFESYKQGIREFNPEIWSKWHKTQLFQLLPNSIQTILFIDADVLAQKPLDKSFLPSLAPIMADRTCELSSYPERWYTTLPIIGKSTKKEAGKICGFMSIQKRKETAPFLNEWSNRLVRPPFTKRDQGKLTLSVEALNTKICELPNRWRHIQNQADLMDRIWFSIFGEGTFLHIASSKKWSKNEGFSWQEMATKKCDLSNLPDKAPISKKSTEQHRVR